MYTTWLVTVMYAPGFNDLVWVMLFERSDDVGSLQMACLPSKESKSVGHPVTRGGVVSTVNVMYMHTLY